MTVGECGVLCRSHKNGRVDKGCLPVLFVFVFGNASSYEHYTS